MKSGIIIGIVAIIGIVYFISKKSNPSKPFIQVAKQIQLKQLNAVMTGLIEGNLEYEFFGITSNGIDCIYFVNNNGKINIEFEVMTNEQKPYVEKLTNFAKNNRYLISKMTYGNQPQYQELKEAPVYKIELNANKEKATEIGRDIMENIFGNNELTKFDVVP